jgi:ABC-type phosphate transport system substrate-binding protein
MKYFYYVLFLIAVLVSINYAQVAVIVNKSTPAPKMTASSLLQIYILNNTKWPDGTKIIVYYNKEKSIYQKLCDFIGIEIISLRKQWMKLQLSGEAKAPEAIDNDAEMIKRVTSTLGAIGYVNASAIKGKDLKVIATIE